MPDIEPADDEAPTATAADQDTAPEQDTAPDQDTAPEQDVQACSRDAGDTHRSMPQTANATPRSIGKDDAFHLLQNARRRAVLRYLMTHPDQQQFQMRDLAEAVAAWEHDTTVQLLNSAMSSPGTRRPAASWGLSPGVSPRGLIGNVPSDRGP